MQPISLSQNPGRPWGFLGRRSHWRAVGWRAAFCLALSACSTSPTKKGALPPDERADYIEHFGAKTPWEMRQDFVAGRVTPGMPKEWVVFLVGEPDRTAAEHFGVSWDGSSDSVVGQADTQDSIWEYLHERSGKVRFGLKFRSDTVLSVLGSAE
jgi:hypothetical protein